MEHEVSEFSPAENAQLKMLTADRESHARASRRDLREAEENIDEGAATPLAPVFASASNNLGVQSRQRKPPLYLMAESTRRLYFLAVETVDYVESYGNYVLIHCGDQQYVRRGTLKQLASTLLGEGFARIRRSTLVNLARVAFAERLGRGALAFTLISGTQLVSKTGIRLEEPHVGSREDQA